MFQFDLENGWRNLTDPANARFEEVFLRALDYHAPRKKKTLWANENSSISKAFVKRSCYILEWKNCIWKIQLTLNEVTIKQKGISLQIFLVRRKKIIFQNSI